MSIIDICVVGISMLVIFIVFRMVKKDTLPKAEPQQKATEHEEDDQILSPTNSWRVGNVFHDDN